MMNGRTPAYLIVGAVVLLAVLVLSLQPYSAESSGRAFAKPARHYIRAAMRQDYADLMRLSASTAPVGWALRAARSHADSLALWARNAQALTGERQGDTTEVFLYPVGDGCSQSPIVFRFVGSGHAARVVGARSDCLDSHSPPPGR
jgi:hypothetical protein